MERLYVNDSSKVPKLLALGGAISPINEQGPGRYYHQPIKSPRFDTYASSDLANLENLDSPLIRYLRSGSPASSASPVMGHQYHGSSRPRVSTRSPLLAIENLEISPHSRSPKVFKTPVKVEEDVLVMDEILVGPVTSARVRSSDSSGSGGKSFYKKEICLSWKESGSCRHGAKCQFAHGKEELRPSRIHHKNKSETCKSHSSGSCTYGAKCRFIHHQVNTPTSPTTPVLATVQTGSSIKLEHALNSNVDSSQRVTPALAITQTVLPIKLEHALSSNEGGSHCVTPASATTQTVSPIKLELAISSDVDNSSTSTDWFPMDDGIDVSAPPSSPFTAEAPLREDVDAYIRRVLYGPNQRKRLPVFADICPE